MTLRNVLNIKWLVAFGFVLMAIIAFNLSNPTLKRDLVTSFNDWYQTTSQGLHPNADPKAADLSLSIAVTLSDPSLATTPATWTLPTRSLLDSQDRDNTARILQLIKESGVFGLNPVRRGSRSAPSLAISVKDTTRQFEITIPLAEAQNNIQLQNLMKLMDLYTHTPPTPNVEPARL
jgi:hypothetical protein